MLKRENRLRAKQDFGRVRQAGNRWRSDLFSLSVIAHQTGPTRFGFVVSKQVAPQASARNRLKRQMRAIVHGVLARMAPGFDCVFVARSACAAVGYRQLAVEMVKLLVKAGLLTQQIEMP